MNWLLTACLSIVFHCKYAGLILPGKLAFHGIAHCTHSCRSVGIVQCIVLCTARLKGDDTNSIVSVGGCIFTTRQDKQQNGRAWQESCYPFFLSFFLSFLPSLFLSAFFLSFFWHDMNSFLIIDELRTWLPSSIDSDFILETRMLNKCWWLEWNPIGTKFVSTEQCYGTCLHLKYQWCIMGGVCLKSELYSLWPSVHKTTVTNSHNTESLSCFFLSSLCKNVCQSYPSTTLPWMYQACKDPPPPSLSLSFPLFLVPSGNPFCRRWRNKSSLLYTFSVKGGSPFSSLGDYIA